MSTLVNLVTKDIIITRLATVSGNKKAYSTTTATVAEVQPLSPEKTALVDGVMGKTYKIFTEPTVDIQEGDRLREVDTGKIFKVKNGGVSRRTFGSTDFLSIVVEQVN